MPLLQRCIASGCLLRSLHPSPYTANLHHHELHMLLSTCWKLNQLRKPQTQTHLVALAPSTLAPIPNPFNPQFSLANSPHQVDPNLTSIYDKYASFIKFTMNLDHISHCKKRYDTNWSNRWTYPVFIINTRRDWIPQDSTPSPANPNPSTKRTWLISRDRLTSRTVRASPLAIDSSHESSSRASALAHLYT